MTDILGHDVNGKPLRAGDKAVIVHTPVPDMQSWVGRTCKVIGDASADWSDMVWVYVQPSPPPGIEPAIYPEQLRKIDDHEPGDWSEIEKQTGWRPGVRVEA